MTLHRQKATRTYGWLVRVMWRGRKRQVWLAESGHSVADAVRERNRLEREMGKPRTERRIRSGGVLPWARGRRWRRVRGRVRLD